jgi:hypothetical protein
MSVFIGIPAGRSSMSCLTASTLLNLGAILNRRSIDYTFRWISYAEVATARNILAAQFLKSDKDIFIGIDDDVAVDTVALQKMLDHRSPFLGAYLPQRLIDLDAFESAIISGKRGKNARFSAAPYIGVESNPKNPEYGTIDKVQRIGTGFYILQRHVLRTIIERGLAVELHTTTPNFDQKIYGFFNNITDENGAVLSEDFSFCHRVERAGFDINAYLGPGITHTGLMAFGS